jgi:uncharacterized protein (TIGR02246 family)
MSTTTKSRVKTFCAILLLATAACASAQAKKGTDREQIAAIETRIQAAFAAGDGDAVAAEYTEDAVLMPPYRPSLIGRAAIAELYRAVFKDYKCALETHVEEIEVAGDWAWLRGTMTSSVTPKAGGETHVSKGKYLVVARKGADGVWRFARDMYSSDQPPGQ